MWRTEVIEGYPFDLDAALNRLQADGWTIRFMLPNGVNRWTIVCWKDRVDG